MKAHAWLMLLAAALMASTGCHQNEVRLPVTSVADDYVWRPLEDASKYTTETARLELPIDPPIGYVQARERPPEDFVMGTHVEWNELVRKLRDEFGATVREHNHGTTNVERYEQRIGVLKQALEEMRHSRELLVLRLNEYRKLRDEWHSLRWRVGREAETRQEAVRERTETIRQAVESTLSETRHMIKRIQGNEPPPDITV